MITPSIPYGSSGSSNRTPTNTYYLEIGQALFSTDATYSDLYQRRPAAFAKAIKECIDQFVPFCSRTFALSVSSFA